MPRHEWRDDDLISRERGESEYRGERSSRDQGAFFGDDRRRLRRSHGGWGSLLDDESSGSRMRESPDHGHEREAGFGPDDDRRGIPRDETERLIASNKVEGTPAYDRNGDRLGTIHNFMVDKFRGRVLYAVLKHGSGFLGLDDRYYPIDWDQLSFDTRLGGYRVRITEESLRNFGSWDRDERWSDRRSMRSDRPRFDRDRERHSDFRPDYARGSMRERW